MIERFSQSLDWLAFTIPSATVEAVQTLVGGDWIELDTGFRRYPVSWLCGAGREGVGRLGTGARRNQKEVHVDLSAGIVAAWEEVKVRTILEWIFAQQGHVTRMDLALDDRAPLVSVDTILAAVTAGQAVTRCQTFRVVRTTSQRDGTSRGETLYFGSRQSQTLLRVYDKRLELTQKERPDADQFGVRWELEFKEDRAQACAKALVNLQPEDWREFVVGLLRGYVDFRDTTREAEPYEKYRAPLLPWWAELTEGLKAARLLVREDRTSLDDMCNWLGNYVSASLALAYCHRGEAWLRELIYTGSKKWTSKHLGMLNQGRKGKPLLLKLKPKPSS